MQTSSSRLGAVGSRIVAAALLAACTTQVAPAHPAQAVPPAVAAAPACGVVEVEDHSLPPNDARATTVREAARQRLALVSACSRPFRLHIAVTVEQVGTGRLQAKLRAVVYRSTGEVVGDMPMALSAEHTLPEDRAAKEAELLRSGAESTAQLFAENFR